MSFDTAKFDQAKFEPRTREVELEALSEFFDNDSCSWVVRGLTSSELHRAMEAERKHANMTKVIQAIEENADVVTAVRSLVGLSEQVPGEVAKRLEMLSSGSVDPEIQLNIAVKLAENFPVEFMLLTNAITELTGLGFEHVKQKAVSQVTPA